MQSKVSKGLATWAGIIAATGQYALAVALFLDTFDQTDPVAGLGPLVTATATLYAVIRGRMAQAEALIDAKARGGVSLAQPFAYTPGVASSGTAVTGSTFTKPRPGAEMTTYQPSSNVPVEDDDPEPPAGGRTSIASRELDDPEYQDVPTREQHSGLKG